MQIFGGAPATRIPLASIASGITDSHRPCHFCKSLTPKVIAFKAPVTAPVADLLWCCDYCLEAIKKMQHTNQGL